MTGLLKNIKISTVKNRISLKDRQEAEKKRKKMSSSPLLLILYLIGIVGMMYAFVESGVMAFPMFVAVTSFTVVLTSVLWFFYFYRNKQFYVVIGIYCVVAMMLGAWQIPSMANVFENAITSVFLGTGNSGGISFGILALFVLGIVFVLFALEFVLRRHAVLFCLAGALVIAGPLLELKIGPVTIVAVVIFQFGFYVVNMTDAKAKKSFVNGSRAKVAAISTTAIAVLFLIAFIPAYILQAAFAEPLYLGVYQADAVLKDAMDYLTGQYGSDGINGSVSRGNLRQTGEPVINVQLSQASGNMLYLRGFTGSEYSSGYWSEALYGYSEYIDLNSSDFHKEYDENGNIFVTQNSEGRYDEYSDSDSYQAQLMLTQRYKNLVMNIVLSYFDGVSPEDQISIYGDDGRVFVDGVDTDGFQQFMMSIEGPQLYYRITASDDTENENLQAAMISPKDSSYFVDEMDEQIFTDKEFKPRVTLKKNPDDGNYDEFYEVSMEEMLSSSYTGPDWGSYIYSLDKHPEIAELLDFPEDVLTTPTSDITNEVITDTAALFETPTNINITRINSFAYFYTPYGCKYDQAELLSRFSTGKAEGNDYANSFFDQNQLNMSGKWNAQPNSKYVRDSYKSIISETLTHYNTTELPRLSELCSSQSLPKDVNEVTTFILYTLQNKARYTTTPGSVPWNKDALEYFLFDNHKGFCVHYASTAVNMYHMFGIPARYVAGFAVDTSKAEKTDSSLYPYETTVTDYSAHAWAEIFLDDYGWVVVDVTPDQNNRMHAFYPGYDEEEMNRIMEKHGWTFSDSIDAEVDGGAGGAVIGQNMSASFAILALIIPLLILAAVPAVFLIRRSILIKKGKTESCRRSFDRMIRALHFAGLLRDKNGSEYGFAAELSAAAPCIEPSLAEEIMQIMEMDNFSTDRADEQQVQTVRSAREILCTELYRTLPWHKKLIYKYVMALI